MSDNAPKLLDKIRKQLRRKAKSLDDTQGMIWLEKALGDSTSIAPMISHALPWLSQSSAIKGIVEILDGRIEGWTRIHQYWKYNALDAAVWMNYFDQQKTAWEQNHRKGVIRAKQVKFTDLLDGALLSALSLALGEDSLVHLWNRRLIPSSPANSQWVDSRHGWKECGTFEPFMLQLYAEWVSTTHEPEFEGLDSSIVFQRLINLWRSSEADVSDAISAVLDYHVAHITENKKVLYVTPFDAAPYQLMPVEYYAIKRVRSEQGLPMPHVHHPLTEKEFREVPPSFPRFGTDEILERVITRVRDLIPGFQLPW